jgi:predicted flap endonuclease-1-like 5' DNA nuclease
MRRMVGAAILVVALGSATVLAWLSQRDPVTPANTPPSTAAAIDSARVARPRSPSSPAIPARFPLQPLAFLSSAPAESLEALPGVGPVLATRLVDARRARGPFRSWDEVDRVRGIGPKTIERLKALGRRR